MCTSKPRGIMNVERRSLCIIQYSLFDVHYLPHSNIGTIEAHSFFYCDIMYLCAYVVKFVSIPLEATATWTCSLSTRDACCETLRDNMQTYLMIFFFTPVSVMITGFINPFLSKYMRSMQVIRALRSFSVSGLRW